MNQEFKANKSVARSAFDETKVDEGVLVLTYKNETNEMQSLDKEIDSNFIQFHFCVKGDAQFLFNNGIWISLCVFMILRAISLFYYLDKIYLRFRTN